MPSSYTYDNRYIAEFNFGYNGSENFTKGNRFGFFPSVAVGYMLSEEKFMEKYKDTFSKIKFRASWGLTAYSFSPAFFINTSIIIPKKAKKTAPAFAVCILNSSLTWLGFKEE